jgi:hypothetical protein
MSELSIQATGASLRDIERALSAARSHLRAVRVDPVDAAAGFASVAAWNEKGCPAAETPPAEHFRWQRAWGGALREARKMLRRFDPNRELIMSVEPENIESHRTTMAREKSAGMVRGLAALPAMLEWARAFYMRWSDLEPCDAENILDWAYELFPTHGHRQAEDVALEAWEQMLAKEGERRSTAGSPGRHTNPGAALPGAQ